jgi:hypothetical protein
MTYQPGDLAVLDSPLAKTLLTSTTPARLSYVALDGTPRVVPIWFHWNGRQLVFGTSPGSPKLKAIAAKPALAVTIDTTVWPYQALMIRGRAEIERVEGIVPEYALSATRYFGPERGPAWIDQIAPRYTEMMRLTLNPDWAWLLDYAEQPEPR